MVPSTGIEPVTFPMSRERATAAPTGLKSFLYYTKSSTIIKVFRLKDYAFGLCLGINFVGCLF